MCAILITVGMHSKLMYCFSCYISILVTGKLFAIYIDAVIEQRFKCKEHTDARIWTPTSRYLIYHIPVTVQPPQEDH